MSCFFKTKSSVLIVQILWTYSFLNDNDFIEVIAGKNQTEAEIKVTRAFIFKKMELSIYSIFIV